MYLLLLQKCWLLNINLTQKYKLWIKCVCVIQLSLRLLNFVVSFPRCCYYMRLTSLHVYNTPISCFPQLLNWRVSYHFPEQGSCYGMCQQMQAVYQVTVHGEIITETLYVYIYEGCFFFQPPMGYKKKTNWHNIIILLAKVQQGLTYFST